MINIVTVTLNKKESLKKCMEALYINTPNDLFHYTIVDQGSTDDTLKWLSDVKHYFYTTTNNTFDIVSFRKNMGVSWAHNYVWRNYPGEHYIKLDPDMIVETPGWLETMTKIAEENKAIVGCIGINVEGKHYKQTMLSGIPIDVKEEGNIGGACIMVPNYVNRQIGYWNVLSQPYGEEDALMGIRIKKLRRLNIYLGDKFRAKHIDNDTKEYREFKDKCREINIKPDGEYLTLWNEYAKGVRSLRVE